MEVSVVCSSCLSLRTYFLGKLLYTPFRKCVIPPPMCSHELKLSSPANEVVFSPCFQRMLVLQSDGRVALFFISPDEQSSKDQHGFCQVTLYLKMVATTRCGITGIKLAVMMLPPLQFTTWWSSNTPSPHLVQWRSVARGCVGRGNTIRSVIWVSTDSFRRWLPYQVGQIFMIYCWYVTYSSVEW